MKKKYCRRWLLESHEITFFFFISYSVLFFEYMFFFFFFFATPFSPVSVYICMPFFFFSILTLIAVKNPCFFSFLNSMLFLCCAPYMLAVSAFLPFSYPLSFSFRLLLLKIVFFLVFCFPMLRYLLLPECRFFICSFAFFFFLLPLFYCDDGEQTISCSYLLPELFLFAVFPFFFYAKFVF